ncbi:MAG: hypothetical protein IJZ26_02090 [Clostridia bacterium]|nr:hypothetical protein [Clostridia bacterium]
MQEILDEKIRAFYNACTDMCNAKFILADAKISQILKTIVASPELIATVGEALVNFNFDNEFAKAQVKNNITYLQFNLPKEPEKIVGLVFGLLSEFDAHRLDLHTFIRDYFNGDGRLIVDCFNDFVECIILPFRDAMCYMLGYETDGYKAEKSTETEQNVEEEPVDEEVENLLGNFFDDITTILSQIQETVNRDPKVKDDRKDEINITIDATIESIELGNLKIMNALLISLNYLLSPIKSIRFYNQELQDRLLDFYDNE